MPIRRTLRLLPWLLVCCPLPVGAATFTVTSVAFSGTGSLADAINQANAAPGADTIAFAIAGTGVKVLDVPSSGYPQITDTLVIDGYTQSGAAANSNATGGLNTVLRIELDAGGVSSNPTLRLAAPTTLRGLAISNIEPGGIGVRILGAGAGSSIRGCFIGTTAAGVGNSSGEGLDIEAQAQIGSATPADRNLIAAVTGGMDISGEGTIIQGNLFGSLPDGSGTGSANQQIAIAITMIANGTRNVLIGGTGAGQGNTFRNIGGVAIRFANGAQAATAVSILGNSFDGIAGVPIDLGGDGVDPIDPGDVDTGPNGRENAPRMLYARKHGTQLLLQVQFEGDFGGNKRIEFFVSPTANPSGSGPGAVLVAAVTLGASAGAATRFIDVNLTVPALPGLLLPQVVTATATAADGSTSEFSNPAPLIDGGASRVVSNTNDSGGGSFRQALLDANANAGMDAIQFNIAGAGPHTITPLTALPGVVGPLIIDGYTQNGSAPNSAVSGSNAILQISLDGSSTGGGGLLNVSSGTLTIRGMNLRSAGNAGLQFLGGENHVVEGCFIGTDVTGMVDQGNAGSGISSDSSVTGLRVGGPGKHQRNVVSGNNAVGLNLSGDNWLVQNNLLGTAADGLTPLGNSFGALFVVGSSGGHVTGNRIRNNATRGIGLAPSAIQIDIEANDIFGNAGLGIDLNNDGLTLNDANDADAGPNGLQNFPVLGSVVSLASGNLRVEGSIDRPASGSHQFRIDVFRSTTCDNTHGEGEQFLGSANVSYLAGTPETFSLQLPGVSLPAGSVVTTTATNGAGATSEFSACITSSVQPDAVYANGFE